MFLIAGGVEQKRRRAKRRIWSAVLKRSVPAPVAVLKLPSVLLKSENQPTAVFAAPVVRLKKGLGPFCSIEVGIAAVRRRDNPLRVWKSAKQTKANVIRTVEYLFSYPGVSEKCRQLVEAIRRKSRSVASSSKNAVSSSAARTTKRFLSLSRSPLLGNERSVNQLLGIVDHLRRRFARFKLCAHLLHLRCLFLSCCEGRGTSDLSLLDGRFCSALCGAL